MMISYEERLESCVCTSFHFSFSPALSYGYHVTFASRLNHFKREFLSLLRPRARRINLIKVAPCCTDLIDLYSLMTRFLMGYTWHTRDMGQNKAKDR